MPLLETITGRLSCLLSLIVIGFITAGCGGGAVRFAPTPLPPDLAPVTYRHPSGAFTVTLPETWARFERSADDLAAAHFTPPGGSAPALFISVIRVEDDAALTTRINTFQTSVRPDVGRYSEQNRQALDDGAWRLGGIRITPGRLPQQVNTFIQQSGDYVGVVEIVLPENADQLTRLERIVNTFRIVGDADGLEAAPFARLAAGLRPDLEIANVSTWATPEDVYFITGEVANYGVDAVGGVPVRVELSAAEGQGIIEAVDMVMGYSLLPGEYAPFSLRFGQLPPEEATHFTLTLGDTEWSEAGTQMRGILGGESLTWTDESTFTDENHLLITGTVTNTSSRTVYAPLATITVFDSGQNVIAAAFTTITEGLPESGALRPDERVDFTVRIQELGGEPANYIVNVQALPARP